MNKQTSELERIFDDMCRNYRLAHKLFGGRNGPKFMAQDPLYFLELEKQENWTRLLYGDRVATADIYDCEDQKYLTYSVLTIYQDGQASFLQTLDSSIAKKLLENPINEKIQIDRHVTIVELDDFSKVEEFLSAHIGNY